MAGCGCASTCSPTKKVSPRFRKALWIALVINALMFVVEIVGGLKPNLFHCGQMHSILQEIQQIMLCL